MARSTVHYADNATNNILKRLHNKLRPAGTPVQRVEYIIELLLLRIFEVKLKREDEFIQIRNLFKGENNDLLFSTLDAISNEQILSKLNTRFFPFYAKILGEARKVYKGNPSIKVQDQIVLIEEVFSNSNFTNNVQSGNLREIIGLVSELDEELLIKTDLLGDAIESALSETGGTKDIGLHRTPNHIRQFMVGLVQPTFDDLIFDPTAGTAGFLFDSYEYVMQCVLKDDNWPGAKAHPELAAWFKTHFAKQKISMPSIEKTTDFYRTGVTGIEYLGMIRKMAAINFYIRGLNPGNILQGDSLAMFKKEFFPESKTAIIANPPFGAERDQDAYPDVWSEYPKESETTILFVKLMLETLKKTGRCAVIVSEGFMTWDQNSARSLRKSLLDDANLKAIISLPQGVFVSKGGQGPKTSILYFEKGKPTNHVWFYKVGNDGYTMGTNRKPIAGCQLVEALDIFDKYVSRGKIPPDTKHSFTIPAEWIKTLDPRVKERIRTETRTELTAKAEEERTKLIENLTTRKNNGKLKDAEMQERLAQHEQVWQNRIHNEIAKRIERAHLFSFNLVNYRSNLTTEQVDAWKKRNMAVSEKTLLDTLYQRIESARLGELDALLTKLDPRNALELDIARQFISKLDEKMFSVHPHLKTLADIIATQAKYPMVKLKELIEPIYERIKKEEYDGSLPIVEKISFGDGKIVFREEKETGMDLYRAPKGNLVTSKINIHQGAVALAPSDLVASTHYQMYKIHTEDVVPLFLIAMLRSTQFLGLLNEQKSKGIKNEQGAEFFGEFEIPLPPLEVQEALVAEIERQRAIIEGAEKIIESWKPEIPEDGDATKPLGDVIMLHRGYDLPESQWLQGNVPIIGSNGIIGYHNVSKAKGPGVVTGRSGTIGKVHYIKDDFWPHNTSLYVSDFKENYPRFIFYLLQTVDLKSLADNTTAVPSLDRKNAHKLSVVAPPIEQQKLIAEELDKELELIEKLRNRKMRSEQRIADIISKVWES